MKRETVLHLMKSADTLEDVERAKVARNAWLDEHPYDEAVLQLSSFLFRVEEAPRGLAANGVDVPAMRAASHAEFEAELAAVLRRIDEDELCALMDKARTLDELLSARQVCTAAGKRQFTQSPH